MNGSVTPKVIGFSPCGSGRLAMSSSRWFCQKQSPQATTSTAALTTIRVRSSSRCSTSVMRSSNLAALRRATALRAMLAYDLALNRLRGRLARVRDLGPLRLVVVLAGDRGAELADALAEGATQLRQPLGAEDHQGDDQDDRQLEGSNVRHWLMVAMRHLRQDGWPGSALSPARS